MVDSDESRRSDIGGNPIETTERRLRDGTAGAGDMLGGLGAGAGDRLGPDHGNDEDADARHGMPNQHSFADEAPAVDTAENYHGVDDPA